MPVVLRWDISGETMFETVNGVVLVGVSVPRGWVCDGPSIPKFLRNILPRTDKYLRAAFVHDYCLEVLELGWVDSNRKFRQALKRSGVKTHLRYILMAGVTIGRAMDRSKAIFGVNRYGP